MRCLHAVLKKTARIVVEENDQKKVRNMFLKKQDFWEIFCKLIYGLQNLAIFLGLNACLFLKYIFPMIFIGELLINSHSQDRKR